MNQPTYTIDIPATQIPPFMNQVANDIHQGENIDPQNLVRAQKEFDALKAAYDSALPALSAATVNSSAIRLNKIQMQHTFAGDPMAGAPIWAVNMNNGLQQAINQLNVKLVCLQNENRGGGDLRSFVEVPNAHGVVPSAANMHPLESVAFVAQLSRQALNGYLGHYEAAMPNEALQQKKQRLLDIIGSSVGLQYHGNA